MTESDFKLLVELIQDAGLTERLHFTEVHLMETATSTFDSNNLSGFRLLYHFTDASGADATVELWYGFTLGYTLCANAQSNPKWWHRLSSMSSPGLKYFTTPEAMQFATQLMVVFNRWRRLILERDLALGSPDMAAWRQSNVKYNELPEKLKILIRGTVTEHEDGSISVDGSVHWVQWRLTRIPIKFRRVTGDFLMQRNELLNLENAPDWVGGFFWCEHNQLTSLDGLGEVKGDIACGGNPVSISELLTDYRRKRARIELA